MPHRHPAAAKRYRAVTIDAPAGACRWARKIAGYRFLIEQAPAIPLRECDVSECHCRYREYPDRRQDTRRASDAGVDEARFTGVERRQRPDRRRRLPEDEACYVDDV